MQYGTSTLQLIIQQEHRQQCSSSLLKTGEIITKWVPNNYTIHTSIILLYYCNLEFHFQIYSITIDRGIKYYRVVDQDFWAHQIKMSDILAPEVVVPLLADVSEESALFRLSNLRGKWVLLLFPRQGKETLIRDFLFQVERWTNEKEPDWTSYNCQIVVVSNSREIDVQHLPSITFVFDEDRTMASSFHCSEENTTFADVATVLIDSEGKNTMQYSLIYVLSIQYLIL